MEFLLGRLFRTACRGWGHHHVAGHSQERLTPCEGGDHNSSRAAIVPMLARARMCAGVKG